MDLYDFLMAFGSLVSFVVCLSLFIQKMTQTRKDSSLNNMNNRTDEIATH